jgi:hypothetical protein
MHFIIFRIAAELCAVPSHELPFDGMMLLDLGPAHKKISHIFTRHYTATHCAFARVAEEVI